MPSLAVIVQRIDEVEAWHRLPNRPRSHEPESLFDVDRPRRGPIVEELCEQRAWLLDDARLHPPARSRGKLLVYDPEASLFDGAAEAESGGFFDDRNLPLWDTWVAFVEERPRTQDWSPFESYLLCWIPESLVPVAQRGIDVNAEECIVWADPLRTPSLVDLLALLAP